MKKSIVNWINKNMDMIWVIAFSLGIISIIKFGEKLMNSSNAWVGIVGIAISVLGLVLTGIFIYKSTPRLIKQIKLLIGK